MGSSRRTETVRRNEELIKEHQQEEEKRGCELNSWERGTRRVERGQKNIHLGSPQYEEALLVIKLIKARKTSKNKLKLMLQPQKLLKVFSKYQ